ncbi:hypothetical protein EsH8_V_001017 [Colletotrichum jinshuiense]
MEYNRTISGSTFRDGARIHQGDNHYHGSPDHNGQCLKDLRVTDPRRDKERIEDTKGGLLADCYRWVLGHTDFLQWRNDPQSRLLWIKGDPGKGKTMLLCGIINELNKTADEASRPVYFFCQATNADLNSGTAVLRGLIYILVKQQPALMMYLRAEYEHAGKRLFEDFNAWYALSQMLTHMLEDPLLKDQILIIDALDECVTDLQRLLNFISKSSSSSRAKWLVSSRNLLVVEQTLDSITQRVRLCLELNEDAISAAVCAYIQYKVDQLALKPKNYDKETRAAVQEYLLRNANDTFLWVALVCQELMSLDVRKRHALQKIKTFPPGLDALYTRMMDLIDKSGDAEYCKQVLAVSSAVYRPITLTELSIFVRPFEEYQDYLSSLEEIVSSCGSFLTVKDNIVYFLHQSAKDFLLQKVPNKKTLDLGIERTHHAIFSRSLEVLHKRLQRDIYNLQAPGTAIDQVRPPVPDPLASLRYSCIHWVDHLCNVRSSGVDGRNEKLDEETVYDFLQKKFIYWLEALSLLRSLSEGVIAIQNLMEWAIKVTSSKRLSDFAQDAHRFTLSQRSAIEAAPLQVYASALVFSPTRSLVRETFKAEIPKWITMQPVVSADWDACLMTLQAHFSIIASVTFAVDGRRLAAGFVNGNIQIRDPATGACLSTLFRHLNIPVHSVTFSTDGQRLASGFKDGSIMIWDIATGTYESPVGGYFNGYSVTAFTTDLQRAARGRELGTIETWDLIHGACISTLKGHSKIVFCVAFTADGTRLASGSGDRTVKIWDLATGACVLTLKGNGALAMSIAFTPDGRRLASGSTDRTIQIWNAATGARISKLKGHSDGVDCVAFTADGTRLASGSEDQTVKIWDLATGACVLTLEGHVEPVTSIAFTPDGRRLASGSARGIIKIWDLAILPCVPIVEGHTKEVKCIAFTTDSKQLASGSMDGTIKIWDPATSVCALTLRHGSVVKSLKYAPDGQRLTSTSRDGFFKLWDLAEGVCVLSLTDENFSTFPHAFSADSQKFAMGFRNGTVKIWDMTTVACVLTLESYAIPIVSAAFTTDGRQLALGFVNGTINIWDLTLGICVLTLKGHHQSVWFVMFTADDQRLASGSGDMTIKMWELVAGTCISTFGMNDFRYNEFLGQQPLNESLGGVAIWDPATGACMSTVPVGLGIAIPKAIAHINSSQLLTDTDVVVLNSRSGAGSQSWFPYQARVSSLGYGISLDGGWVMRGDNEILWLPLEYRSEALAVVGNIVAIGCKTGRVVFIQLSTESIGL